ncbi:hydantoinase B/oxoprolinase family protein [Thermodesulforhabdus norvegica]|uniref:N-methylhydantoinase B n=1 Tax=Thermodesulforhabdus norvegica TaxID=39841 RepID=A0A1I4UI43_9BACT|nr:hydantoinase B/oxoprolinase family protein [Thermodesulforhabdus norvegica]SFM88669.1 N-methylhydantoinase B [Thermodesulforhabdus norvegica]
MSREINPVLLEVFKNRFASIAEEMGVTLNRTAYSPNIKERRDFSCALFDAKGQMVAQAAHIPVHLGSMPLSVKSAIETCSFSPGDMVILNDPYKGGTHLPDVTLVAPVFAGSDGPVFFVANRAHHADIGGMSSGSMPLSRSLYQEGLIIPPVKLVEQGRLDRKIMDILLNNVRTPEEREGDLDAQIMANMTGIKRLEELISKYGLETCVSYAEALMDYAEKVMRGVISGIPDGTYSFTDFMDDDGVEREDIAIRLELKVSGDEAVLDFTGSDPQVAGSINAVYAITLSAALYVFRCLVDEDVPTNAGLIRPISVVTRKGTIVDAVFPAPVAGGNVETSQRIVDVILGALAQAIPEKIPAASQGTMNNITIGGVRPDSGVSFAYYETIGGGMGAASDGDGESAVHSHMTNTLNTPVEALEYTYPLMITTYSIRRGSGGEGRFRGGDGIVREIKLLTDSEVTILSERRRRGPYGLYGGEPGSRGRNIIVSDGVEREVGGKFHGYLKAGDVLRIETPGGGGYGSPEG